MANILNRRKWVFLPLLSVGFALAVFIHTSHAALLKDIRVGEYPGFTRIVFELDAPPKPAKIEPQSTGRLAVVFANTTADLTRKIPVERSPHVRNIQIWEKGAELTTILAFDFNSYDHKFFSLSDPPRLVLDIRPLASAPDTIVAPPPEKPQSGKSGIEPATPPQDSQTARRQGSMHQESESRRPSPHTDDKFDSPISDDHSEHGPASGAQGDEVVSAKGGAMQSTRAATRKPDRAKNSVNTGKLSLKQPRYTVQPSVKRPDRLQYFLVIFLVFITIAILVLLVLMLLVKHAWIERRPGLTDSMQSEVQKEPRTVHKRESQ
jgi:hypothetical protein